MAHAHIAKQTSERAGQRPRRPPRPERARGFGRRHGEQVPVARRQPGEAVGSNAPVARRRSANPFRDGNFAHSQHDSAWTGENFWWEVEKVSRWASRKRCAAACGPGRGGGSFYAPSGGLEQLELAARGEGF